MKVFGFYKSKKYLQRVMFSIMLSMVIVLLALSVANTYILEKSVKSNQEESNLKVLTQIQYNLSYMNEIITHLSNFVYNDNQLVPLMFDTDLPKMDFIRSYQEMSKVLDSSSFLHSMVIYNFKQDELYGTTSAFMLDGGVTKQKIRNWLINSTDDRPTSRLIPVSLEHDEGQIDAFAFIVTKTLKPFSHKESAIVLYIKSDWVFDSLKKMNVVSSREQGEIFIVAEDGQLYSANHNKAETSKQDQSYIKQVVNDDKLATNQQSGFVIVKIAGKKSMVSYMENDNRNLSIFYIQSYDKLMEQVTRTRITSIIIAGVFLIFSIGLSIWLSYQLYHPIENMLKRIRLHTSDDRQSGFKTGDELQMMSENYMKLSSKLQEISSEQIVNKYYIRKFLTDSQMFSHNDMLSLIEKHDLNISIREQIKVCVLKIDYYAAYDRNTTSSSKKLYSFAIVNIAQEIMAKRYPCEAVEVRGDHVVLIVSKSESDEDITFESIVPLICEIQDTIERYYSLNLSCGISDTISQFSYISSGYTQALQLSLYKIIKGNKSVITSDEIKENVANTQTSIPETIEKKLAEALKKGQMTEAGTELEKAFSLLANFRYEDIVREISNLAWLIKNTALDIKNNRIVQFADDIDYIHLIPQEKETLEEMFFSLLSVCSQICEGQKPAKMERNEMILETIKELIEQKYADINLSQQSIALNVKLSSAYIGTLFKDSYRISITEYINDVRLNHVKMYLEKDNYTVLEIMDKCGYANPSYFFRLFKAKYGSTPKEYRMKKSMF
ncbi:helix-turn-helix transcriptional regulator [Paenibacillus psychroresistens]|uniref:helix-turn-helix transcriptional regulator n=1 Tax=Paenibacillus psychroresistens TaxID=1778678 RepID=UPI001390C0D0|nr:AraC family transcriptional regulator [Paenibacillus psychroresistens]